MDPPISCSKVRCTIKQARFYKNNVPLRRLLFNMTNIIRKGLRLIYA
jgi:hypothetical protein